MGTSREIRRLGREAGAGLRPAATVAAADVPIDRAEFSQARDLAKAWAGTVPDLHRADHAFLFAWRSLDVVASEASPAFALRPPSAAQGRLDNMAERLAISIGEMLAGFPIDEALHLATSLYPTLLPSKVRSDLGAFYTPPVLARRLFDQAEEAGLDWRTARVLDPATGGGVFLREAARRMVVAQPDCEPTFLLAQIGSRLAGFELDPRAASLAQGSLELLLSKLVALTSRPIPDIVAVCDTLEAEPRPIFDLVVGNPPYGRVTLSASQRQRYARGLYGHANLYGIFTDAALRWARAGGLIGYLTPTSFLGGQYFSALRGLLAKEAPPVAIDFVHARRGVFEDVLQETLLAVYKRGGEPTGARIHYLTVVNESEAKVTRNGTVTLPADRGMPWLAPRSPEHGSLIAHAATMTGRLADWNYSVSTGPLVWNRFKDQLRDRAGGRDVHPLIWAEAVTSDGRFVYRANKRNHAPYFKLEPGDDWLLVKEPCILVQRTTAKEQARRLMVAELPRDFVARHGGVVVENHLNMVRVNGKPRIPSAVVAALLNSRIVDELFRCMSGSVAVSAFELEALPLPSVKEMRQLVQMVSAGAPSRVIDAECARLYGQTG